MGTPVELHFLEYTFDALTVETALKVHAARLYLPNGLTLGATMTLDEGNLSFEGSNHDVVIDGTGDIVFGDTPDSLSSLISVVASRNLTIDPGITIRTGTADGSIVSNVPGRAVRLEGFPLQIAGSMHAGPGSTIILTNYTLEPEAQVDVQIGGVATSQFGRLTTTGSATLDGTLNVSLTNGFSPMLGQTFGILTYASGVGTFATENGTDLGGGLFFQANYNSSGVDLGVTN